MTSAERLARLEAAHAELAAQHLALMTLFRCVAPLIRPPGGVAGAALLAYDLSSELAQSSGMDDAQRRRVLHWIEVIAAAFEAGQRSPPLPSRT